MVIDNDQELRRAVLEQRRAEYERTLINLEYEARTVREIGQQLKLPMTEELNQIKAQTRKMLICLKVTVRFLAELDGPPVEERSLNGVAP